MLNNLFEKFASEKVINIEGIDFYIRELVCTYEPGVYTVEMVVSAKVKDDEA